MSNILETYETLCVWHNDDGYVGEKYDNISDEKQC